MATPPLPNIPVGILIASLQEYGAYLYQWQVHAEALSRELQEVRARSTEVEKENEELRDCRDILQRMVDVQRELITSLEVDLARANEERHISPCIRDDNGLSSSSTLTPVLDMAEVNLCTRVSYSSLANPTPNPRKHPADADIGGPSKKVRGEESGGVETELAELLQS